MIQRAGGVAVLAHPGIIDFPENFSPGQLVDMLMTMGLAGIEAHHTDHTPEQTCFFEKIATTRGLLVTGGSDFHGVIKPEVHMGTGTGDLHVPRYHCEALMDRLMQMHKNPSRTGTP